MKHPFEVGGRYRNRIGEYEVVEIQDPEMVIRYDSGETATVKQAIAARIWENIQIDELIEKEGGASRPRSRRSTSGASGTRRSSRDRWGARFQGLQKGDFQKSVTGTSWRARPNLGGALALRMVGVAGRDFESHALYRRAEVHIVEPKYYKKADRLREAKFELDLDAERARYGLYIEKSDQPMDKSWDWLSCLDALEGDAALRSGIEEAMRRLDLHWELWMGEGEYVAQVGIGQDALIWVEQEGNESQEISWAEFVERLRSLEAKTWHDLHLCVRLDKEQVIAQGQGLANTVVAVYKALLPLYEASTRRA